jgi:hypothetical protein
MPDETTPLLWESNALEDPHKQFCLLAGVPPSDGSLDKKHPFVIGDKTLYGRATRQYKRARRTHSFMSGLNNVLLLSQVILGATLTALGASESSHILITLFGVMNTVIAGLVAYMKSRGQPARTRLYRDDLEMVVDQIENSEIMWLGISRNIHGYDEIDIDDKVTVRGEIARLMRLYEKAHRSFVMSNPDNYLMGQADSSGTALRSRAGVGGGFPPAPPAVTLPAVAPAAAPAAAAPAPPLAPAAQEHDEDASPASAPTAAVKDNDAASTKSDEVAKPDADPKKDDIAPPPAKENNTDSALKDSPPSYKDSPNASKEELKPSTTEEAKKETPVETPAPTSSTAAPQVPATPDAGNDPDESPATAAKGFERTSSYASNRSGKGKDKEENGK